MGVVVSTVTVTEAEGWKLVLTGKGVIQIQGLLELLIKVGASLPSAYEGAFQKLPGDEATNTDSTINIYAKIKDQDGISSIAVWQEAVL